MPRPGSSIVATGVENTPQASQTENKPTLGRRLSCRLTEPIVVSIPGVNNSNKRVTTRRRPSSVLLQLSPQKESASPFKTADESRDSLKHLLGPAFTIAESRVAAHSSHNFVSLSSPTESGKSQKSSQTTSTRGNYAQTRDLSGRTGTKKTVSPKPKPAPTAPLPELPIARAQGTRRVPFEAIQSQT